MKEGALFDFDGTVTYSDTTKYLIFEFLKKRPLRLFLLLKSLFLIKTSTNPEIIQLSKNKAIAILVKGLATEQVDLIVSNFLKKIRTLTRPIVINRITKLYDEGKNIFIVTASPSFALKTFFDNIEVITIGTEFSMKDGIYDGNMETASCYGNEKVGRIEAWLSDNGFKIKFTESWSDSISDLPMMQLTDNHYWVAGDDKKILTSEDPSGIFINE